LLAGIGATNVYHTSARATGATAQHVITDPINTTATIEYVLRTA
jgi:hypothetical protein